jgi:hypothetical protein
MAKVPGIEIVEEPKKPLEFVQINEAKTPNWDLTDGSTPHAPSIYNIPDLVQALKKDPTLDIEARIYGVKEGIARPFKLNKQQFLEAWDKNSNLSSFRESIDYFGTDSNMGGAPGGIGKDFTPLLGGPFNKQLYYHDYLEMIANSFFAINHDPILRNAVDMIMNFVLGRGYRVDCDNPDGLILWRAFEKTNNLQQKIRLMLREMLTYGETMIWWLPDNKTEIRYMVPPEQAAQQGLLPRIRLIDPSTVWDYITMPEDIETKIAYVQNFPTQYQLYQGDLNGKRVPSTKYIFQQIPAEQVDHYKINCMSNEKRGRSLLFPVLGYAKRLRDSVNYSIIALQKQSSWSIDTTIDGNQQDIENYNQQVQSFGQFVPPGSEFIHSTKVKREYLNNSGGKGGTNDAFTWCLDMIAAGLGIPVNYFGTSHSSGQSRAGAIVATEPVAKKMEEYQQTLENILLQMGDRLFKMFNIKGELEITFPEVITQDRSQKLKDLAIAEAQGWISHSRAAEIAAKELQITSFEWEDERAQIDREKSAPDAAEYLPLSTPGKLPQTGNSEPQAKDSSSAVTNDEKRNIKINART